jgi:hypothetical protein
MMVILLRVSHLILQQNIVNNVILKILELNESNAQKLLVMLQHHMANLLCKIEEDEEEDRSSRASGNTTSSISGIPAPPNI